MNVINIFLPNDTVETRFELRQPPINVEITDTNADSPIMLKLIYWCYQENTVDNNNQI